MFNEWTDFGNLKADEILVVICPWVISVILYSYYYFKVNKRILKENTKIFRFVAEKAGEFQGCAIGNLSLLEEALPGSLPSGFDKAWRNMKRQSEQRFTEGLLPEAAVFFKEQDLLVIPSRRGEIKALGFVTVFMMVLSVAAPLLYSVLLQKEFGGGFVLGVLSALLIAVFYIFFYFADSRAYTKMAMAYQQFLEAFELAVPTANEVSASALLVEALEKNQRAYESMAEKISSSFADNVAKVTSAIDEFTKDAVVTVLSDSMESIAKTHISPVLGDMGSTVNTAMRELMARQDAGVRDLADSFAQQLDGTLKIRMDRMAEALTDYQERVEQHDAAFEAKMAEQNKVFEARVERQNADFEGRMNGLNASLALSLAEIEKWMDKQSGLLQKSELSYGKIAGLLEAEQSSKAEMQQDLKKTTDSIAVLKDQVQNFAGQSMEFSSNSLAAQQKLGEIVEGMTGNLRLAMEVAGREIAEGINKAVADNAKAIEDLTIQSQLLRDDYSQFFGQRDESIKQTIEEMDYQLQGMIGRMSEDIGTILDKAVRENGEILAQYRESTASIAHSFEEQAMSLNLYAKEIHYDVAGLSENLNASVEKFNADIRQGIEHTFADFDKGMGELAGRISETVESIADSVDNLSKVLKG